MALLDGERANYQTLLRASDNGDLALIECTERATGRRVAVLAAIAFNGDEYVITPLARLFDSNPYEDLDPPSEQPKPSPPANANAS
jgi:hypothetical protein